MSRNESDAIVKRTSNVNDVRCGKRTDNESVAGSTTATVTRSEEGEGGVVKNDDIVK